MATRKASEVFVECLEAEGAKYVFGIPGEETLDLNESLADSDVQFVPVRHEQGGAYMADAYGRLTGRAGVCLGTLGPGATNLVTAVADAFLDRAPLVALTGQSDLERMHKESHQYIDLIAIMRPIVKWNARVSSPEIVPEVVRKAFAVAESEKPGSTHLELPEDVMVRPLDASPLPRHTPVQPEPGTRELQRATDLIMSAERPIILAGNGAIRGHASRALRAFVHTTGIPVAETFMAKGLIDFEDPHALGTVGLQSRDYEMAGFDDADLVIAVGYDLVEHAPEHWNPRRDKQIVVIDTVSAEIDEFFLPTVELVGDIAHVLARLAAGVNRPPDEVVESTRLRDLVLGELRERRRRRPFPDAAAAGPDRHPPGAAPQRHPGLRRRPAQALDRAHVPRPRARHGADRQRSGGHGVRAADRDRRQAREPKPACGHGFGRRRLLDELPGARDRRSDSRRRSSTSSGRTSSSARSSGSRTTSSAATSASTSGRRTSSSWPRRSARPRGAARRPPSSPSACRRRSRSTCRR